MNIKHIKGLTFALILSAFSSSSYANNDSGTDKEISYLLEEIAKTEEESLELEKVVSGGKIFVYDLQGRLVFALEESEMLPQHYKVLFQSDLVMESLGNKYYVKTNG